MLLEMFLVKTPSIVVGIVHFLISSHSIFATVLFCHFVYSACSLILRFSFALFMLLLFCKRKEKMPNSCLRVWFQCKWFEVFAGFSVSAHYNVIFELWARCKNTDVHLHIIPEKRMITLVTTTKQQKEFGLLKFFPGYLPICKKL